MRIPLDRIYRAFPELDRFDDVACQRFVKQAKRAKRWSHAAIVVLFAPAFLAVLLVSGFVWAVLFDWLASTLRGDPFSKVQIALAMVQVVLTFGVPALILLWVRDSWLRWALKSQISTTNCLCSYSLLGLTIEEGAVQCPECGDRVVLADRGLTPKMLLAGEMKHND